MNAGVLIVMLKQNDKANSGCFPSLVKQKKAKMS